MIEEMELEMWCHYAQRMTIVKARRVPVCTTVGSAVAVIDCVKPCQLYKTEKCLIGRRVEGAFY
jgi:hypothetical protein